MLGVAAVVSQFGNAPASTPQISCEGGAILGPNSVPTLPGGGEGVLTTKSVP